MIRPLLLLGCLVTPLAARSEQPKALHDKLWYSQHDATRISTLKLCHSDASYSHKYDCQNAEAAQTGVAFGAPAPAPPAAIDGGGGAGVDTMPTTNEGDPVLDTPTYWAGLWPVSRHSWLEMCDHPFRGVATPHCPAVRAGEALAQAGHGRR